MPGPRKPASPFRYFNSSPEVIRLVVMMYMRFPLSLRKVEELLFERGCRHKQQLIGYTSDPQQLLQYYMYINLINNRSFNVLSSQVQYSSI